MEIPRYQPEPFPEIYGVKELPMFPGNNWADAAFKGRHNKCQMLTSNKTKAAFAELKEVPKPPETEHTRKIEACWRQAGITTENASFAIDEVVLRFYAYFLEPVPESSDPDHVHKVVILFFPMDDTMMVLEPKIPNSGFLAGTLIKRHRVSLALKNRRRTNRNQDALSNTQRRLPQEDFGSESFVTINDLNVGSELTVYGKDFTIVDCDESTRLFLEQLGVVVPDAFQYPVDEHVISRMHQDTLVGLRPKTWADLDLKMTFEQSVKGRTVMHFPEDILRTQKFLADNHHVLCFRAVWDDRHSPHGDCRFFEVRYHLCDDTIEVAEKHRANAGRDPTTKFFLRKRLAKDPATNAGGYGLTFANRINGAMSDADPSMYYCPKDLAIGQRINLNGRILFLVDCDPFTRDWYKKEQTQTPQPQPIDAFKMFGLEPKDFPTRLPPNHNGYGTEEDSLGNWSNLVLKAPKFDLKKWHQFDGKVLRFSLKFHKPSSSDDSTRSFLLSFFLGDDTIQVTEQTTRNSGQIGGRFLKRQKVKKCIGEGSLCYYNFADFYAGAVVNIMSHIFQVISMDDFTRRFRYKSELIPKEVTIDSIKFLIAQLQAETGISFDSSSKPLVEFIQEISNASFINNSTSIATAVKIILETMSQFNRDFDGLSTVQQFSEAISGHLLVDEDDCSIATPVKSYNDSSDSEKTSICLRALKKFRAALQLRNVTTSDAFRMVSALPRCAQDCGSNTTNSITSFVNRFQLRTACEKTFKLNLSDIELTLLLEAFFQVKAGQEGGGSGTVSLMEFIAVMTRLEDNLPPLGSKK